MLKAEALTAPASLGAALQPEHLALIEAAEATRPHRAPTPRPARPGRRPAGGEREQCQQDGGQPEVQRAPWMGVGKPTADLHADQAAHAEQGQRRRHYARGDPAPR